MLALTKPDISQPIFIKCVRNIYKLILPVLPFKFFVLPYGKCKPWAQEVF